MTPVEMLAATGGRAVHAERLPREVHIVTDTRALAAGETFLALRGERFDGHRFTAEARAKGAAAVIVDDAAAAPPGIAAIVVPDTKKAYLSLAATARNALRARVVAITGST
jgi:UDP-N-acetylmuramoyl-tripeptide--D-alanyl-D-alanine ligase